VIEKILSDQEYYELIKEIVNHPEFEKRKEFLHHEGESVYDHVLEVSYYSYLFCKKKNLDYKSAAIGGILHDFYPQPWQNVKKTKKKFFEMHGFVHAKEALENSKKIFPQYITPKVENIILRHMFPLNITPPKYKEAWVVTMVDKKLSMRIFKKPTCLLKYIGIRKD
jgi:uncharacterized protein